MNASARNAAQIDYWNGDVGRRWAEMQDRLDGMMLAVAALAIEAAAPKPGERTIDIGCGCGATVLELASAVGSSGQVTGFDISQVMLDVASRRIAAAGFGQARVVLADAASYPFEPQSADLVFSRFGVMFFDAPVEAFAALKKALKPGGRMAFVCWRAQNENVWVTVPMAAAKPFLDAEDETPPDPYAPGPFAFADAGRLRAILTEAGFSSIEIAPADTLLPLAATGDLKAAAGLVTRVGPVSRALKAVDDARRVKAEAAVAEALAHHDGPGGVSLPAAIWVVTARA